jgi:hypothetical protein
MEPVILIFPVLWRLESYVPVPVTVPVPAPYLDHKNKIFQKSFGKNLAFLGT